MKHFLILTFVTLLQLVTITGCTKEQATGNNQPDSLGKSFLALGDSYTIGESVSSAERFPAQTISLLKDIGLYYAAPEYIAQTGWTSFDLQQAMLDTELKKKYDLVTLLIGVNDQFQGLDTSGYRKRFTQLLVKALQLAGNEVSHVFVLSIPDYGVTPYGGGSAIITKEINQFNAINQEIALAHQVTYINITPISRVAATDQTLTAYDGLHPSGKQYTLWAEQLAAAIKKIYI